MIIRQINRVVGKAAYVSALVLAATLFTAWIEPYLPAPAPTGVVLLSIMIISVTSGVLSAAFAAILGWLSYNFFLEAPRFQIQFNSARDFYVVSIFASVGLFTGLLAQRLRTECRTAKLRALQLDFLFRASRRFSSIGDRDALCHATVELMSDSGCLDPYVHFYSPAATCSSAISPPLQLGQWLIEAQSPDSLVDGDWTGRALLVGSSHLGWAAWRTGGPDPKDRTDLKVLLDLSASALNRIGDLDTASPR